MPEVRSLTSYDDSDICALGVHELARRYRDGRLSPVDVTTATLERIARLNSRLNAYITVIADSAVAAAECAAIQLANGIDFGPLHGVPVSIKDNINVRGTRTTAASRVLAAAPLDHTDALVVSRLRRAGAVLLGKVNLAEFALVADPDGPFGNVQNPRRIGYQAGASSSGSAAAVAAGLCVLSVGTDTGGSIRHPASVCGVVGLKPTFGLVPTQGVIPNSTALDHVGLLARSVRDVGAGLNAIAANGAAHDGSAVAAADAGMLQRSVRGWRLGIPTNPFYRFGQPEVLQLVDAARHLLQDELGLTPIQVEAPMVEDANEIADLLIAVDVCTYHERFSERSTLYGPAFVERTNLGRTATAIEYAQAREAQSRIRRAWLRLFEAIDFLVIPANVAGAPRHGVDMLDIAGASHPARVNSRYNRVSNLTGFPALTLPIGDVDGLPVGIQLVGSPHSEARLLALGHALEQACGSLSASWGIELRDNQDPRSPD
jgi:aspartyl-tRNA(Asn)/glutamyl-tRNA(Gln) amidotransferase subunit A